MVVFQNMSTNHDAVKEGAVYNNITGDATYGEMYYIMSVEAILLYTPSRCGY